MYFILFSEMLRASITLLKILQKETLEQVFSCEFWEIYQSSCFYRTSLVAASGWSEENIQLSNVSCSQSSQFAHF